MAMSEDRLSARCPKCHTEMIYVAALAHPKSPTMRKTIFVCYGCNQTRNYALSEEMAHAYLASHGDPLVTVDTEAEATLTA
jgi:RNase P subunit RPR2